MAPFPFPDLESLCDKYRYNIHPHGMAFDGEEMPSFDDDILAGQAGCFSGLTPIAMSSMPRPDFLKILGSAHPALQQRVTTPSPPSPNVCAPAPSSQDLHELERIYQKSRYRQRHAMLYLAPMPLTRNVHRVKGHTLERQHHGPTGHLTAGPVRPIEAIPVPQQDEQSSAHPRTYLKTQKQTEAPKQAGGNRLWAAQQKGDKHQSAERRVEISQAGVMNDIICSSHSSVLEGTDVDFSEALDSSPSLPKRQFSALTRNTSTESSSSSSSTSVSTTESTPADDGFAVAQLITTADEDLRAERDSLLSCPDLLVAVHRQDQHLSQPAMPSSPLKLSAEAISSIAYRLHRPTSKPENSPGMPSFMPAASLTSPQLPLRENFISSRNNSTANGWLDHRSSSGSSSQGDFIVTSPQLGNPPGDPQGNGSLRYSSDSSGDESTSSMEALPGHTPRLGQRDKTHSLRTVQQRHRQRCFNNSQAAAHSYMDSSDDSSATVIGSDSDESGDDYDLLKSSTWQNGLARKRHQMASVWQNHTTNLRRIQLVSQSRRTASTVCSLTTSTTDKKNRPGSQSTLLTRQQLFNRGTKSLTEFHGVLGSSQSPEPLPLAISHVF